MMILSEELFVGKGAHKKCYIHPDNPSLCVKVLFKVPDTDLDREMAYRKSRERRKLDSILLARYLGSIETNMGTGYIYERVCDFDGANSMPLDEYIEKIRMNGANRLELEKLILDFKELWFKEKIITSNVELANFLVQRRSEKDYSIRIVDNIGSPSVVPLAFYFDYFADKRLKRYWKRFVDLLKDSYPLICDENFINKIE